MTQTADYVYTGKELELFAEALNWKRYLARRIRPHLGRRVLEVGAGVAATTPYLCSRRQVDWLCLEPDDLFVKQVGAKITTGELPSQCRVRLGTVNSLPADTLFDTIVYIDVLEHIADDRSELTDSAARLEPGGKVIVLSPAHQWLYSDFDQSIGHYRRYNRSLLLAAAPPELVPVHTEYLDGVGMFASLANRTLLRQSMPRKEQLRSWDRYMIPVSRWTDAATRRFGGRSILGVFRRAER